MSSAYVVKAHSTGLDPEPVALKLRALASDPDNQNYLAREQGCMSGLISFLASPLEHRVALVAAQAVHFLSTNPTNKEVLSSNKRLRVRLRRLTHSQNPNLAHFAKATLANLDSNAECASAVTSFRKKSLECVKLSLPSVEEELQRSIEKTLLSVCGVVSVSMIPRRNTALVYSVTKDLASDLIDALARLGVDAAEILSGSRGAERAEAAVSAPSSGPQYLEHRSFEARPDAISVYANSFEESSLSNRLARQRKEQREKAAQQQKAQTIFSKIGSLIW